jgi:hypothetical protein
MEFHNLSLGDLQDPGISTAEVPDGGGSRVPIAHAGLLVLSSPGPEGKTRRSVPPNDDQLLPLFLRQGNHSYLLM